MRGNRIVPNTQPQRMSQPRCLRMTCSMSCTNGRTNTGRSECHQRPGFRRSGTAAIELERERTEERCEYLLDFVSCELLELLGHQFVQLRSDARNAQRFRRVELGHELNAMQIIGAMPSRNRWDTRNS